MAQEAQPGRGLEHWMERVVREADKVRGGFDPDPVHDLRVAIRRCRSIADGFRMIDSQPAWRKMRRSAKALFSALGDLRDVQVQKEWVEKLGTEGDPVRDRLLAHFHQREQELKNAAAQVLADFDTSQWKDWADELGPRAEHIPVGGEVFQVIALERLLQARKLHTMAMKNRSKTALHAVRIGLKKFRYIVENFLPEHHDKWIKELKYIQDLLGEIHDLDVLSETARAVHAFETPEQQAHWREAMQSERMKRLDQYRAKMLGKQSLWAQWRAGLPSGEDLRQAILKKFEVWSALRDPDRLHTESVLRLSLEVFDFLTQERLLKAGDIEGVAQRDLLTIAVLGHEAGRVKPGKHHKTVVKVFEKLDLPPGWLPIHLRIGGLVARYHAGAPPNEAQTQYGALPKLARAIVDRLAGVIRLADALERQRDTSTYDVNIARNNGHVVITAAGVHERTREAERISAARHLLESVCGIPIVVRPA